MYGGHHRLFKTRTVWLANSRLAFHLMTQFVCVCVPTPPSSVQMHGYEWNDVRGLLKSVFFTFIILWVGMGGRVTPHGPSPSFCPASLTSQREKWVNIYTHTHNHVDFNLYIKPDTTHHLDWASPNPFIRLFLSYIFFCKLFGEDIPTHTSKGPRYIFWLFGFW
jgi:hypothetical protein